MKLLQRVNKEKQFSSQFRLFAFFFPNQNHFLIVWISFRCFFLLFLFIFVTHNKWRLLRLAYSQWTITRSRYCNIWSEEGDKDNPLFISRWSKSHVKILIGLDTFSHRVEIASSFVNICVLLRVTSMNKLSEYKRLLVKRCRGRLSWKINSKHHGN